MSENSSRANRMRAIVAHMIEYMATYPNQKGYESYSDETFIDDILYGLGLSIDQEKYKWANGFDAFKKRLMKHITESL